MIAKVQCVCNCKLTTIRGGKYTRDTKVQMINKLKKIKNGPLFAHVTEIESKILPLPQGLPL